MLKHDIGIVLCFWSVLKPWTSLKKCPDAILKLIETFKDAQTSSKSAQTPPQNAPRDLNDTETPSRSAQTPPQNAPRRPQTAPNLPKERPDASPRRLKTSQEGSQNRLREPPNRAKPKIDTFGTKFEGFWSSLGAIFDSFLKLFGQAKCKTNAVCLEWCFEAVLEARFRSILNDFCDTCNVLSLMIEARSWSVIRC